MAHVPRKVAAGCGQPHPLSSYKYHFLYVPYCGTALADASEMMAELAG